MVHLPLLIQRIYRRCNLLHPTQSLMVYDSLVMMVGYGQWVADDMIGVYLIMVLAWYRLSYLLTEDKPFVGTILSMRLNID